MAKRSPAVDLSLLRQHLLEMLKGGSAHITFDDAVADLAVTARGAKPGKSPHTAWRLVEHLRIAQRDILEFSRIANHKSPKWPDEYWPATDSPPNNAAWQKALKDFRSDLAAMIALVKNPKTDLLAKIPWGDGQTIAREALLLADHNAYHIGQLVELRRALGAWSD